MGSEFELRGSGMVNATPPIHCIISPVILPVQIGGDDLRR